MKKGITVGTVIIDITTGQERIARHIRIIIIQYIWFVVWLHIIPLGGGVVFHMLGESDKGNKTCKS
jgi:hypothetical protein